MGDVAVTLKVMPEDNEVDLEELKGEIESRIDVEEMKEEPVAFGLKAIKVMTIVPDDAGGSDALQEKLSEISVVKNVEVTDQRKLM